MNCKVIHVRLQKADHIKIKWIGTCVFIYNTATWPCKTPFIRNVSLCFFSSPDSVYRLCADVQYIYFIKCFSIIWDGGGGGGGGVISKTEVKFGGDHHWYWRILIGWDGCRWWWRGQEFKLYPPVKWEMLIRLYAGGSIHNICNFKWFIPFDHDECNWVISLVQVPPRVI